MWWAAEVRVSVTSDGALDVQLRTPVEMGGEGGGTNPEQRLPWATPRGLREHSVSSNVESEWNSGPFP